MAELQIRLPYTGWGDGDEWHGGYEQILGDLYVLVEASGLGIVDEPDHFNDCICFYVIGEDVDALRRAAREVLTRHNLLSLASAMVTDPNANDVDVGTPVTL